ncbi:MAG: FAD-dependent monooxygenase [Bacteroidota bacterium]
MKIGVIGGGIGGLSLGIALRHMGIDCTVYEQSKSLKPVGAGILLGNNVMQIYDKLGLRASLEEVSNPIHELQITKPSLKPMSRVSLVRFAKKYGVNNLSIHRAALQGVLAESFAERGGKLKLGCSFQSFEEKGQKVTACFENGDTETFDGLVGADGINSKVRKQLFPKSRIISAGQYCWRGVVDYKLPDPIRHTVREAWGKGTRFGHVAIDERRVYWFAVQSEDLGPVEPPSQAWRGHFKNYDPLVSELIEKTDRDSIHAAPLMELSLLKRWSAGNVTLLGDAAHAMTPNMGQGAGQAIEDAYALANVLSSGGSISQAFDLYHNKRKKKVGRIVKTSRHIGVVSHWQSAIGAFFRNRMITITPDWMNQRQLAYVFEI